MLLPDSQNEQIFDLSLLGPDQKSRAFELFWRETGDESQMLLKADKIKLQDDKKLLWEASLPKNFLTGSIQVKLPYFSDTARLDFAGFINEKWEDIEQNIAVMRVSPGIAMGIAEVSFVPRNYEKFRVYFQGFDQKFNDTPVHSVEVYASTRRDGVGFKNLTITPEIEQAQVEGHKEVRIKLPGSGIFIESISLSTEGLFAGKWAVGSEKIILGRREFQAEKTGEVDGVDDEPDKLRIRLGRMWKDRSLIIQLKTQDYFGEVKQAEVDVQLPRIAFVADMSGRYYLQTGANKLRQVREYAQSAEKQISSKVVFTDFETNNEWQAESLLKDFSIGGGPFDPTGYTWKAPLIIENPGFYQLQMSLQAMLEANPKSIRIVKDMRQVPFFPGRTEHREEPLNYNHDFVAQGNESIYTIRLPAVKKSPLRLIVKTSGIFSREVVLQKHQAGKVSWQPWKYITWKNNKNAPVKLNVDLSGFPQDQKDLRLVIRNGNNQSLKIDEISAVYPAFDLYFVATEPGQYELYGGGKSLKAPNYDLAIIQHKLFELFPQKITHGDLLDISKADAVSQPGQDKGGPFSPVGYSWVADFTVSQPGLSQLQLNQQASLDNYRSSIRLVKDNNQIPYFVGSTYSKKVPVKYDLDYDREKNLSVVRLNLPQASRHWQALEIFVPGIFERRPVFMLRKPGNLGWKKWQEMVWTGTSQNANSFTLSLSALPKGETELRIEIAHGDNSPVVISAINAVFSSQDLFFYAADTGTYKIYGGNRDAAVPAYDLTLIRDKMLNSEPNKIKMGEVSAFSRTDIGKQLQDAFSERGWGLYIVLALVTLILLVVIVKIFPDGQAEVEDEKAADARKVKDGAKEAEGTSKKEEDQHKKD
jgi:hypothetical protein